MYITPYAFLLVAALCTTKTLAKDGKGDSIPRRRDHGLDVCIHVCNKFADGEMRWKAVCNACINNGDGTATLDFECKIAQGHARESIIVPV
jgi:hypothetical protein